jgi:hypothetical protein
MRLLFLFMTLGLFACQPKIDRTQLRGNWRVDSVYRYYNGFDMHLPGKADDPTYRYLAGNKVREQKGRDYREYSWEWHEPDTLVYRAPEGAVIGAYQVLELRPARMVLKRQQANIFEGEGQQRYEIRYFSLTESQP